MPFTSCVTLEMLLNVPKPPFKNGDGNIYFIRLLSRFFFSNQIKSLAHTRYAFNEQLLNFGILKNRLRVQLSMQIPRTLSPERHMFHNHLQVILMSMNHGPATHSETLQ